MIALVSVSKIKKKMKGFYYCQKFNKYRTDLFCATTDSTFYCSKSFLYLFINVIIQHYCMSFMFQALCCVLATQ